MKRSKNLIIAFLASVAILLLILNPSRYINSCLNGFIVFGTKVLPALFPFFFLTKILTETGVVYELSNKLNFLTNKFFKTSGMSSYIFLMSIISGYPVGAKLTADFYEKNLIDANEAFRITTFSSTSGPLFIIGTIGTGMLFNYQVGVIIFISHILASVFNGVIFSRYKSKNFSNNALSFKFKMPKSELSDCMYNALISIMLVGGFVAFFYVVVDMLFSFNFINRLGDFKGVLAGLIEVTRGSLELSKSNVNMSLISSIICFLISFGGVSIHMQALTFLNKCKIKKRMYFLQKTIHAFIGFLICFVLSSLLL